MEHPENWYQVLGLIHTLGFSPEQTGGNIVVWTKKIQDQYVIAVSENDFLVNVYDSWKEDENECQWGSLVATNSYNSFDEVFDYLYFLTKCMKGL